MAAFLDHKIGDVRVRRSLREETAPITLLRHTHARLAGIAAGRGARMNFRGRYNFILHATTVCVKHPMVP